MYSLIKKIDDVLLVVFKSETIEDCHSEAKSKAITDYFIFSELNGVTSQVFPIIEPQVQEEPVPTIEE